MKSEVRISGNRLQITRIFDAPRHLVFGWWTRAEKLRQWSGCKEATRCEVDMDFRIGGSFTQKMQIVVNGGRASFRSAVHTTKSWNRKRSSTTRTLARP